MIVSVDRAAYEAALSRLPDAHALALRLAEAGVSDPELCRQLGIERESLEPLLDLARRKLATELALG
jgi:DNA-directed RNA polymerase specialized sigma24 family protein